MKMNNLKLDVVRFSSEDVIATSLGIISVSAYRTISGGDTQFDSYAAVGYTGMMTYFDSEENSWHFNDQDGPFGITADDLNDYQTHPVLSASTYDIYYKDHSFYTKGAYYNELYNNQ